MAAKKNIFISSSENVNKENKHSIDFSHLSSEELEALVELAISKIIFANPRHSPYSHYVNMDFNTYPPYIDKIRKPFLHDIVDNSSGDAQDEINNALKATEKKVHAILFPDKINKHDFNAEFVDLSNKYDKVLLKLNEFDNKLNNVLEENILIKNDLYNVLIEKDYSAKIQHIPVSIYVDTEDQNLIFNAYISLLTAIESLGFKKSFEFNSEKGSWFKRVVARSKDVMTSDEVTSRFKEAEYALEVNTILKPQSEIDKNQSEALLNIITSLEKIPNAVIRIGSLLVVKETNAEGSPFIQCRSLSILENYYINKNPQLLKQPSKILNELALIADNNSSDKLLKDKEV